MKFIHYNRTLGWPLVSTRIIISLAVVTLGGCDPATAGEEEVYGTWKLISNQIKVLETGEVRDFEPGVALSGYINYGPDHRMIALGFRGNRPQPESVQKMTDQERVDLFNTMVSYGGTYKFDGSTMYHNIDISWNQIWTGTTQIRDVKREGNKLIYTTRPAPLVGSGADDGKMGISILTWERVQ
jgi:hypothetical protein